MACHITPHILIVDDDGAICTTLSTILQSEGYETATATTAKEALAKTKTQFFNIILLDIKLPDLEGTQLLAQLQEITPETIKIMITGYPSIKNAVEALNLGASSYIIKPIDPPELLKMIKRKLEAQQQAEKITKRKLAELVQSRLRRDQSSKFQDFLEETANELADFGLTGTSAKIYISLTALGVASPSEIAALSKVRREEVYRMMPKLEKHGLITRKLKAPRRFSAVTPETAIQLLAKTKLETMKEEIERLEQKQTELVSKLKTVELPLQPDDCFTEVIPSQGHLFIKTMNMAKNAQRRIDAVISLEYLEYTYLNCPASFKEELAKTTEIRIIIESHKPDALTEEIMRNSKSSKNRIEWRQTEKMPFNIMIVDDNEAIWGEFQFKNENVQNLWSNNPTQIAILKIAFESLWLKP